LHGYEPPGGVEAALFESVCLLPVVADERQIAAPFPAGLFDARVGEREARGRLANVGTRGDR
jgi:hypothetical protein